MVQSKVYDNPEYSFKNDFKEIDADLLQRFIEICDMQQEKGIKCKDCSIQDVCKDLKKVHSVKKLNDLKL